MLRNGPGGAQKGSEMVREELKRLAQKAQKWSGRSPKRRSERTKRLRAQKWSGQKRLGFGQKSRKRETTQSVDFSTKKSHF